MRSSVSGVGVLDKAVSIVDALEREPLALGGLVDATGLSRATAHRLATALEFHGLVRRDEEGRFTLGVRLLALGRAASATYSLRDVAGPMLASLRDATGESVQLFVRQGDRRVCIATLESPHGLRTIVELGASLPLDRGSAGRVLAAVDRVPTRGWVESVEERERGVASVSAPVRDHDGRAVAAVSVSGPVERTSRSPGRRYGKAVAHAAQAIGQAMFGPERG